jgi:hypothetical protein
MAKGNHPTKQIEVADERRIARSDRNRSCDREPVHSGMLPCFFGGLLSRLF